MEKNCSRYAAQHLEAVVTSYNQGEMLLEAVQSLCRQTILPQKIIISDDGSTDAVSVDILRQMEQDKNMPVPVEVICQKNQGVSAARNAGIRCTKEPFVLVLDGDDRLKPAYIEQVSHLLDENPSMVAASSWMQTFGTLEAVVCPKGGSVVPFLAKNCCPATHILRRTVWEQCKGYDESMRAGFEDWDFFLSMLETAEDAVIGIVEEPLMEYRTASASSNVKSMTKRLDLMRFIMEKHETIYQTHLVEAMLGIEETSIARLAGWEQEILHAVTEKNEISDGSAEFLNHPSYGDGGMAAAVRIATNQNSFRSDLVRRKFSCYSDREKKHFV